MALEMFQGASGYHPFDHESLIALSDLSELIVEAPRMHRFPAMGANLQFKLWLDNCSTANR